MKLVAACPPELRPGQDGKGVLKDIGRDLLPVEVVDRQKGYFPVPALTLLDGEVLDLLRSAMSAPAARRRGALEMWLQQHGIG